MNRKIVAKTAEKIVVIAVSVMYIIKLIHLSIILFREQESYVGFLPIAFSTVDNIFDAALSFERIFSLVAGILVIAGIVHVFKRKELRLNKYFQYPVYLLFISNIFYYIVFIWRSVGAKEEDNLWEEEQVPLEWYEYFLSYFGEFILVVLLIYVILKRHIPVIKLVEVHKLKRLFNWLLDTLHITVFTVLIFWPNSYDYWSIDFSSVHLNALLLIFTFLYYFSLELAFGQTIGKLMDNSFVHYKDNRLKAIFLRTICRFIPFEPFSFLFAEKGWHDQLSDTSVVIEKKSYSEEEQETKVASEAELVEVRF